MTIECSRNTVRESSHIYFLWRGPFLSRSATAGWHTRGADWSAWVTSRSLPSLKRPADLSLSLERPTDLSPLFERRVDLSPRWSDQRISAFSPKLQTLYCLFKSIEEVWTSSSPHVFFSVYGWLSELTYFRFFTVICWSYLRTEISVTLSIGNKLYSRYHILYFSFLRKRLYWCYLATALNLLSSSMVLCR